MKIAAIIEKNFLNELHRLLVKEELVSKEDKYCEMSYEEIMVIRD